MLVKPRIPALITNITVLLHMPQPLAALIFIRVRVSQEAQGERKLSVQTRFILRMLKSEKLDYQKLHITPMIISMFFNRLLRLSMKQASIQVETKRVLTLRNMIH
nr:MAG TPA: hypothetical protein [Caudoviricetes sp.]